MWARLQLGAGMFYGSSAVLSVVSALRGRRATWRWNELMGPSTMRGLGVLDTVAAKPVPRRGAQRRERASKRRKFMPKTACTRRDDFFRIDFSEGAATGYILLADRCRSLRHAWGASRTYDPSPISSTEQIWIFDRIKCTAPRTVLTIVVLGAAPLTAPH